MAINLRQVGMESFVTETRREQGKLVQTYMGSYKNPFVRFIYRKSELQKAVSRHLRQEENFTRKRSRDIERILKLLVAIAGHLPILIVLSANQPWEPKQMAITNTEQNTRNSASKPDEECITQALDILPAKRAFGQLCKKADAGDPDANEKLGQLISQAPGLLDSMGDLVRFARQSVLQSISGGSVVFTTALNARINQMEKDIKAAHENDPILGMTAEIVAVTYLDAMRCSLLALKGQENHSDEVQHQGLADRSLRRFVGMQKTYQRLLEQKKRLKLRR